MSKKNYKCRLLPHQRTDCLNIQEARQRAGWNITAFDLPEVWGKTQGEGIVIAVLDTGCDLDHPDLKENLLPGINITDPKKSPEDGNGHGTHVSGTLVAANNDIGVVGVCPKAKVRPVKVLDDKGSGNMLHVAEGIRWAISQKVDFISMSLGSPAKVQQVRKALQAAVKQGIIPFCAAGNANSSEVYYPAFYNESVAIGSSDEDFGRSDFSNKGNRLDFLAPGGEILSCVPNNWYAVMSGTSMAAPFVAGVAALTLSYKRKKGLDFPFRTSQDFRNLFDEYTLPITDKVITNRNFYEGFGIINPVKFFEDLSK